MKLQWLPPAARALDREYDFLADRNPQAARRVFRRIVQATRQLADFPDSGRPGHVQGTRELVVPGLPYLIVYQVRANTIEILRVFHTARNWPETLQDGEEENRP
jgi:toxin ParE1/3/4